jgi:hypothetical protein
MTMKGIVMESKVSPKNVLTKGVTNSILQLLQIPLKLGKHIFVTCQINIRGVLYNDALRNIIHTAELLKKEEQACLQIIVFVDLSLAASYVFYQ